MARRSCVSVLFNEPKLLKCSARGGGRSRVESFSALQRAEIAEMRLQHRRNFARASFSALQRAEIAEIDWEEGEVDPEKDCFSALQRAEIAEI